MVEKVTQYRAKDGELFDHEDMAERHELICTITGKMVSAIENFTDNRGFHQSKDARTATIQFVQNAREEIKTFLQLTEIKVNGLEQMDGAAKDSDFVCDYDFYRFSRLIDHMLIDVYKLSIPYDVEMEIKLKFYKDFDYDQMTESGNPYDYVVKYISDRHDVFVNKLKEVAD